MDRHAHLTTRRGPAALQSRGFRRLYLALGLSSFGDWLGFLATTALAAEYTHGFAARAFATGGVLAFRLAPAVLFGAVGGALADRVDRRRLMVVTDLLRFALFASVPLVHTLLWLLVASFAVELLSLLWIPAKEASVPNLVPREHLESANQLSLIATYGTAPVAAVAYALVGRLDAYLPSDPPSLALYADALTFLFAAVQASRLVELSERRPADPGAEVPSLVGSVREGLAFARTTPLVRGLLVGILGALAAGGTVVAQGRLFAQTVLGGGDAAYGLLFGAVFVGIALGVAVGPRLIGDLSRRRAFGISVTMAGGLLVVVSLVPDLAVAVLGVLLTGAFAGIAYVVGLTLLGGEVADDVRGRAFGLVQSLMRVDLLLVTATTPFIAGAVGRHDVHGVSVNGVAVTLFAGGLLALVVGIVSYRQMDDRPGVPLRSDLYRLFVRDRAGVGLPGTLVVLEGGEGAGKTTQLRLLAAWLAAQGHEVVVSREPGATATGAAVRALLLDPASALAPRTEALLYAADRAQHVAEVLQPALARGALVLCDRFVDSSLAYQGAGRQLAAQDVERLSAFATGGLQPDLVLLLDVDPAVGLARAADRGRPDRLEAESLQFHRRVRQQFLDLAAKAPERYLVVPADGAVHDVQQALRARVATLVPAVARVPA